MAPEQALVALIAAFNQPDPAVFEAFIAERNAIDGAAPWWASFRRTAGPFALVRIEKSETNAVTATIEDRWDRLFEIKLRVDAEPPNVITAANVAPVARLEDALPPRMTWPQIEQALAAKIADSVERNQLSGALMISRDGRALYQVAYGYADREAQRANSLDTRFRVGSMNKMFTGVAVLQLAQAGLIGLDDNVGRHLPDYPNRPFKETVTVRQLLNHTAGAGDFFGPEFTAHRLELRDPRDFVALLGHRDPEFKPGSQHKYANYGFIVLGRIVEMASGQSYDDCVAANIFDVADMRRTGAQPEDTVVEGRAVGYTDGPTGLIRNDQMLPFRGTPAGGGYSTVGDLVRFAEALAAGKLLEDGHRQFIGAGGVEVGSQVWYGAGFIEYRQSGVRTVGHNGGAPGMNGTLLIFPDTGYVVAALSNGDPPQADSLGNFVGLRLPAA
jgi:CubicO group peptidase (beta-lactamase class C family)